jgi:hypothetical protein
MWDKTYDSLTAWMHMNGLKKRTNANAYYSPGVNRFFAVDAFDPYTSYEIGQILSSKMSSISICILTMSDPLIDNNNCHEYTLASNSFLSGRGNVLWNRQLPTIRKAPPESLVHAIDLPTDYKAPSDNFNTFMAFKSYAQFVIQAWHSAKISEMFFNISPMDSYMTDYFSEATPSELYNMVDSVNGPLQTGITREIKKILYNSNSSDEALALIADMWANNSTHMGWEWRNFYYKMLGVEMPPDLKAVDITTANIDKYTGFIL